MKHEDFSRYWLMRDNNGKVFAIDSEHDELPKVVFNELDVSKEWVNPLRSTCLLYNQLTQQYNALQSMIEVSEGISGPSPLIGMLIELQNAILITQQAAREGIEKVAAVIDRERNQA